MSTSRGDTLDTARQAVLAALADLRDAATASDGQDLIEQLPFLRSVTRQVEYDTAHPITRLDTESEFTERGVHPTPAVADPLGRGRGPARQ